MGYLRLLLSLIVMAAHLTPPNLQHSWANLAVPIFWAISGYGCTAAMKGKYQGKPLEFLINRWWRLWPIYLAVFALNSWIWLAFAAPWKLTMPTGLGWVAQLFMLVPQEGKLIPPAWFLPYLLLGYVAIALGASATARRSAVWLALSLALEKQWAFAQMGGAVYQNLATTSLSFAVGASLYWLGGKMPRDSRRWDVWAGALSYPVFLAHYGVGAAISERFNIPMGLPLFFAALPPTLAISWLLVVAVERPVARYRKTLKATP